MVGCSYQWKLAPSVSLSHFGISTAFCRPPRMTLGLGTQLTFVCLSFNQHAMSQHVDVADLLLWVYLGKFMDERLLSRHRAWSQRWVNPVAWVSRLTLGKYCGNPDSVVPLCSSMRGIKLATFRGEVEDEHQRISSHAWYSPLVLPASCGEGRRHGIVERMCMSFVKML